MTNSGAVTSKNNESMLLVPDSVLAYRKVLESDLYVVCASLGFNSLRELESAILSDSLAPEAVDNVERLTLGLQTSHVAPEFLTDETIFIALFGREFAARFEGMYRDQVALLEEAGLLKMSEAGELVIYESGRPPIPRTLPTVEDIRRHILHKSITIENFRKALDLGYTELLLVPFALDPTKLVECLQVELRSKKSRYDIQLSFDASNVDFDALTLGTTYNSNQSTRHPGWWSKFTLVKTAPFPGWSVLMAKPYSASPESYQSFDDIYSSDSLSHNFRLLTTESWCSLLLSELQKLYGEDRVHELNIVSELLLGGSLNGRGLDSFFVEIMNNSYSNLIELHLSTLPDSALPMSARNAYHIN